jgi:hypothetical protein
MRLNRLGANGLAATAGSRGNVGLGRIGLDTNLHEYDSYSSNTSNSIADNYPNHATSKVLLHGHTADELAPVKMPQLGRLTASIGPSLGSSSSQHHAHHHQLMNGNTQGITSPTGISGNKDLIGYHRNRVGVRQTNAASSSSSSSSYNHPSYQAAANSHNYAASSSSKRKGKLLDNLESSNGMSTMTRPSSSMAATANAILSGNMPSSTSSLGDSNTLTLPSIAGATMRQQQQLSASRAATRDQVAENSSSLSIPSSPIGNAGTAGAGGVMIIPASAPQQQRDQATAFHEVHSSSSCSSIRGTKPGNPNWINQDNFFIQEPSPGDSSAPTILCILDGHGECGHHVSRRCRENFMHYLRSTAYDTRRAFSFMQNDLNTCHDFDCR